MTVIEQVTNVTTFSFFQKLSKMFQEEVTKKVKTIQSFMFTYTMLFLNDNKVTYTNNKCTDTQNSIFKAVYRK